MESFGVRSRVVAQPVEGREPVAGSSSSNPPCKNSSTVPVAVNDEPDISIRKAVHHQTPSLDPDNQFPSNASASSKEDEVVVDMCPQSVMDNVKVRQPGLSETDLSINVRDTPRRCYDLTDRLVVNDPTFLREKKKGFVSVGGHDDIKKLLDEGPQFKGVICNDRVLHCVDNKYEEGKQYKVIGTESKGAYGEATMCQDLTTGTTFIRKTLDQSKLQRNEVCVPLMFKGHKGIPEVFGLKITDKRAEIFQEFAGLSLKKMMDSKDESILPVLQQLRDPKMLMALAFQAFATLDKLHSQGVTHQDIKPENICLDFLQKNLCLKFIDFGSSQTPGNLVLEGLTNEYLSPESCQRILRVAQQPGMDKSEARLGPETDVWAMALCLLYCLCGYHVMIYLCTGDTIYRDADPKVVQQKRINCLFKICNLRDEDVDRLLHPSWPAPLRMLLKNTLRVNPKERWTAKVAAKVILDILRGGSATVARQVNPTAEETTQSVSAATQAMRGLAVQSQPSVEASSGTVEEETKLPVQCSSPQSPDPVSSSSSSSGAEFPQPALPSNSQLPVFGDLLSDGLSNKAPRPYKRKNTSESRPGPYRRSSRKK